jgi:hypothetical protein
MLNRYDFPENQLIEIYIIYLFVQIRLFPIFHIFYPISIKFNTRDFHEIIIPTIVILVKIDGARSFQFLRKPYTCILTFLASNHGTLKSYLSLLS